MDMDLNELVSVIKNTGLLTTVGFPVFIYYCIARLRGKISLNWYAFVLPAQAYILTGLYFSIFGPQIVTTRPQTYLYLILGSHVLTTVLCLTLFFTVKPERPRRPLPMNLKYIAVAFFAFYPIWIALGTLHFMAASSNGDCAGQPRCGAALLISGNYGSAGNLFLSAIGIGIAAIWLNFVCYIYLPYIPPEKSEKKDR
ncbi:MAG: hypothetical protein IH625_08840 [Rhodobacteraceae bacterium]|nr:hypothetical protein [Paracoccaceae bacterium]